MISELRTAEFPPRAPPFWPPLKPSFEGRGRRCAVPLGIISLHNFNYVNNPPNNDDRDCFYINCLLSLLLLM